MRRVEHGPATEDSLQQFIDLYPRWPLGKPSSEADANIYRETGLGAGRWQRIGFRPIGPARIGGLICWEHWMPLARMAMHQAGEDIHIAVVANGERGSPTRKPALCV